MEWRDVPGYEGLYQISDTGMVLSLPRERTEGRILRSKPNDNGYQVVVLSRHGEKTTHRIHRLVALAFIPNPDLKAEVNHIDGNKSNNAVANLEWVTRCENLEHARATGLIDPAKANHPNKRAVVRDDGMVFDSIADAARACGSLGIRSAITACCRGNQRTSAGHGWSYA